MFRPLSKLTEECITLVNYREALRDALEMQQDYRMQAVIKEHQINDVAKRLQEQQH